MARRSKGKGRLSEEQLAALEPKKLAEFQKAVLEMGTVSIRTNRKELNSVQVYRIYKQRQAIEQFFKTYGDTLDFEASYMRSRKTQEAWLFLNHISAMIAMDCLNTISAAECDKDISFDDVLEALRKITACKIDGKWLVAPIKSKVVKLLQKLGVAITDQELAAILAASS